MPQKIKQYQLLNSELNGFDQAYKKKIGVLNRDNSTRTFSISPNTGNGENTFGCYLDGVWQEFSNTLSVQVPDVTGLYYIYIDKNDLNLKAVDYSGLTLDDFYKNALVGLVYWNSTAQEGIAANERHGYRMDARTHAYNHLTIGARYGGGFDIVGLANLQTTYTQINDGSIWDEDIQHNYSTATAHKWLYREGTDGAWKTAPTDNELGLDMGGTYRVYNYFDGNTWSLVEGDTDHDFYITFFVAINGLNGAEVFKIPSQNAYGTVGDARAAIDTELQKLSLEGLPSPEYVFLYAMIVRRNGKLRTLDDGSLYLDYRFTKGKGASNNTGAVLESGTYTPTQLASSSAVTSVTINDAQYIRINNIVEVSGNIVAQTNDSTAISYVTLSLPIPSNFTDDNDANGVASVLVDTGSARVKADTTNQGLKIQFRGISNATVYYQVLYTVK